MTDPTDDEEYSDGDYQYRAVFVLGYGWRARPWKDRIGAIEDIGVAAEKGAGATAIERKNTETGQIERAPTPEDEWIAEEDTDLKIRVEDEDQGELVTDGGTQQTAVERYRHVSIVELLRDDPRNDMEKGDQWISFGPDSADYTVLTEDGPRKVTHETVRELYDSDGKTRDEWTEHIKEEVLPLDD